MQEKLDHRQRYVQVAFNYDLNLALRVLPQIAYSDRILIEAGTPFIKREGMRGVHTLRRLWPGIIVADMKVVDGAVGEVTMARNAGADAVTALGDSPTETLNFFIHQCDQLGVISMIDLLGTDDPLDVMRPLKIHPDVAVLHRGRDEENTQGKVIQYRHVNRIRSKYDVNISAAGGVDLKEARSAIFNGANIIVVNLVQPGDPWQGVSTMGNVGEEIAGILSAIE